MIIELKTSSFLNGREQLVSLNKHDILANCETLDLMDKHTIEEMYKYPNDLSILSEDSHGYSIIDLNELDSLLKDLV